MSKFKTTAKLRRLGYKLEGTIEASLKTQLEIFQPTNYGLVIKKNPG